MGGQYTQCSRSVLTRRHAQCKVGSSGLANQQLPDPQQHLPSGRLLQHKLHIFGSFRSLGMYLAPFTGLAHRPTGPPRLRHSRLFLQCVSCSPSGAASSSIFRTATSRYTTFEQSTLEDLKCQICLTTLKNCVALEPCGHNFCATCLSHHLGNQLQSGLQLSCPFRWGLGAAWHNAGLACLDVGLWGLPPVAVCSL